VPRPEPPSVDVQRAFEDLARLSVAEHSLQSLVQRVSDVAARLLPGDPHTSVTVVTDRRPRTVASSGQLATDLDEVQYRLGDGPCVAAATTGRPSEVRDPAGETRWPEFGRLAAERGCTGVVSVPLPVRELVTGGLNVYLGGGQPADGDLAARFAAHAVVPVSNMYLYRGAVDRADQLQAALESRAVIDQAKGILMERYRLKPDQAFALLTRVSMESNTKVRVVAARLAETGELTPE